MVLLADATGVPQRVPATRGRPDPKHDEIHEIRRRGTYRWYQRNIDMTPSGLPPGETPPEQPLLSTAATTAPPVRRYGFPAVLWRGLDKRPPPGLSRIRWRSPLRGPWLTSVFGATLLVVLPIVIVTGLLSYIAYGPRFGQAIPFDVGWLKLAHVRLADTPVVAVPLEPGPARRFGPGGDTGGARQIVVSDSAAVRVATGEVGGPGPGAGDAAHAGGWDPLRDRHRGSQHPVRLHLRVQFLHRTLFRGVGVHRRICLPRLFEAAENGAQPAVTVDAQRSCHLARRHGPRTARRRRAGSSQPRSAHLEPPRRIGRRRRRRPAGRAPHRREDRGWIHPAGAASAPPGPRLRQGTQRLSNQPHRRGGRHRSRRDRRWGAPATAGRLRAGAVGPGRAGGGAGP